MHDFYSLAKDTSSFSIGIMLRMEMIGTNKLETLLFQLQFLILLRLFAWRVCVYMSLCVWTCVCMHVCGGQRSTLDSFLNHFSPF